MPWPSVTFNAADQIYLLTQELETLLINREVKAPMFVAISEDDTTVDAEDAIDFFKSQSIILKIILFMGSIPSPVITVLPP